MKANNQIRQSVKHWQFVSENFKPIHPCEYKRKPNETATLKSTGVVSLFKRTGCLNGRLFSVLKGRGLFIWECFRTDVMFAGKGFQAIWLT